MMDFGQVSQRSTDGSYVIQRDGYPYHVPNEGEWAELWEQVHEYALANPDKVKIELPAPEPEDPPVTSVTPRQARLALLQFGMLQQVNDAIANMGGDAGEAARIMWEYATEISKNDPLLAQITAGLGLSDEQIDQLFELAASL